MAALAGPRSLSDHHVSSGGVRRGPPVDHRFLSRWRRCSSWRPSGTSSRQFSWSCSASCPDVRWHAPLQIILDLVMITGVVYSSGAQDSYFISLYLLAILMGSILFSRRGAFLVAGASFVAARMRRRADLLRHDSADGAIRCRVRAHSNRGWEAISSRSSRWPIWGACWRRRFARRASSSRRKAKS